MLSCRARRETLPEIRPLNHTETAPNVWIPLPLRGLHENWPVWLLSAVLVVAAAIDGWKLKVPNWITFPLVIAGVAYNAMVFGWAGLGSSLVGMASDWPSSCRLTPSAAWARAT